jgi:hypothetical protein
MFGFVSSLALLAGLTLGQIAVPADAPGVSTKVRRASDASVEFFEKGMIPQLRIQVADDELGKLKADNRSYVRCTIVEDGKTTYRDVGIKLKGAAGSFRAWDDRPALTLNSDKSNKTQKFHGLGKFHLNNSVQDETFTHEWLCEELFRSAGVPATRVTHARVWLNDRDVGLYVLKEGFDKTFLRRHFKDRDGNLYDGGFVQDIDAELEKDSGTGPDDRSDLKTLLQACREPNSEDRWKKIETLLDVDAFISFMAVELMTCHWDGYTRNRNNYRLYFSPSDNKAYFLPHGMDQMFGDTNASILDPPGAIVATTVMQNPYWRARYRKRVDQLLPLFHPPSRLQERLEILRQRLEPVLASIDPQRARDHADRVRELKERLAARAISLKQQCDQKEAAPAEFDKDGNLHLTDWRKVSESDDAIVEDVEVEGKKRAYLIQCGASGRCVASWRHKILLVRGTYTFHANVKTNDVAAINDDRGSGAGLRISGDRRTNTVDGNSNWKPVEFNITINDQTREVELVAELRTTRGQALFDTQSLRLSRQTNSPE